MFLQRILTRRGGAFAAPLATCCAATCAFSTQTATATDHHAVEELKPDTWIPLTLVSREELTKGTSRPTHLFSFELNKSQPELPVSSCLLTRAPVGEKKEDGTNKMVIRPYTPVSAPEAKRLDLVIKIYPDGKLTQYLDTLKVGDVLDFKGPIVKLDVKEAEKKTDGIGMIAGGTGITPMLQMAEELLRRGYAAPLQLVYCNVTPDDIMLKDRLDALDEKYSNFSVHYMVDSVPHGQSWTGGVGYVTKDVLSKHMPRSSDKKILVLVCGPPPMMNAISGNKVSPKDQGPLTGLLKNMGYTESQVFKF